MKEWYLHSQSAASKYIIMWANQSTGMYNTVNGVTLPQKYVFQNNNIITFYRKFVFHKWLLSFKQTPR